MEIGLWANKYLACKKLLAEDDSSWPKHRYVNTTKFWTTVMYDFTNFKPQAQDDSYDVLEEKNIILKI